MTDFDKFKAPYMKDLRIIDLKYFEDSLGLMVDHFKIDIKTMDLVINAVHSSLRGVYLKE